MAVIKEYDPGRTERSAEDRRRHKELVEESIKKNIGSIISEESIIGQSGNKKIKIPIRGIKEYSFIYGKNVKGAASGDGDEKRGDVIGEDKDEKGYGIGGAGNQEGEDIYETEITIEELVNYLFDDMKLPDLDKKKLSDIETDNGFRKLGYQKSGIPPRLSKRRSVIEKIKRRQASKRSCEDIGTNGRICGQSWDETKDKRSVENEINGFSCDGEINKQDSDINGNETELETDEQYGNDEIKRDAACERTKERFPFMQDDLRYHRLKKAHKREFNAVVICIMDVSGSMDQTKKYMARSFYFLLYQFLRLRYSNVEVVFVAHTTTAKEVSEQEFFHKGESGGTYISSGYEKALEIIEQRYNPRNWNIYAFHCSDGDNWTEDNKRAVEYAAKLCEVCNLFGYGEIVPGYYYSGSTVKSEYMKSIKADNFVIVTMTKREDIVVGLKKLLEKDGERS
jgi:uncharacterized sporulation protein YeaH/YhbH (DUF444 family)